MVAASRRLIKKWHHVLLVGALPGAGGLYVLPSPLRELSTRSFARVDTDNDKKLNVTELGRAVESTLAPGGLGIGLGIGGGSSRSGSFSFSLPNGVLWEAERADGDASNDDQALDEGEWEHLVEKAWNSSVGFLTSSLYTMAGPCMDISIFDAPGLFSSRRRGSGGGGSAAAASSRLHRDRLLCDFGGDQARAVAHVVSQSRSLLNSASAVLPTLIPVLAVGSATSWLSTTCAKLHYAATIARLFGGDVERSDRVRIQVIWAALVGGPPPGFLPGWGTAPEEGGEGEEEGGWRKGSSSSSGGGGGGGGGDGSSSGESTGAPRDSFERAVADAAATAVPLALNLLWGQNMVEVVVRQVPGYQQALVLTKAAADKAVYDNAVEASALFAPFATPIPEADWAPAGKTPLWQAVLQRVDLFLGRILHVFIWLIQFLFRAVGAVAGALAWGCVAVVRASYGCLMAVLGAAVGGAGYAGGEGGGEGRTATEL